MELLKFLNAVGRCVRSRLCTYLDASCRDERLYNVVALSQEVYCSFQLSGPSQGIRDKGLWKGSTQLTCGQYRGITSRKNTNRYQWWALQMCSNRKTIHKRRAPLLPFPKHRSWVLLVPTMWIFLWWTTGTCSFDTQWLKVTLNQCTCSAAELWSRYDEVDSCSYLTWANSSQLLHMGAVQVKINC